MKQKQAYVLDLIKIGESGDFSCPHCGAVISPDDYTEEVYSILEAKVDKHGLEKLVIRCNKCTSQLHLTGFSLYKSYRGQMKKLTSLRLEKNITTKHKHIRIKCLVELCKSVIN